MQDRFKALTQGLPPLYWLLWSGTLINRLGGFVIPFLTLYLTGQREIPVSQAALMVSFYGAGSFIAQLTGGELADRLGRRPVMLVSFFVTPVAMLALGLVRQVFLIGTATFLVGFFTDLYRPAVSAAIADLVPSGARTRAYGYNYWAINIGAAIAPIVAGQFARHNFLTLFIVDALTTFIFGLIVFFGIRETRPLEAGQQAGGSARTRVRQLGREPILLFFSLLAFFFGVIYMQSHVTLPLAMDSLGLGPDQYGLAIAVNGFMIVLISIPISSMAGKWKRFESMAVSAVFLGLGFGFTLFANVFSLFALSVAIWTVGEIIASAVAPAIIADLSPIELRGLYQGIFGSAWGLAFFVGPLLGGQVYENLGPTYLWMGCLLLGLFVALGLWILRIPARPRMAENLT